MPKEILRAVLGEVLLQAGEVRRAPLVALRELCRRDGLNSALAIRELQHTSLPRYRHRGVGTAEVSTCFEASRPSLLVLVHAVREVDGSSRRFVSTSVSPSNEEFATRVMPCETTLTAFTFTDHPCR